MIAIYTRQSVDKKDSISIESQIEFCKKEVSLSDEFKVYTDKGFSGSNINRPAYEEMNKDIKSGLITKVVVYKLDRISRSIIDFASIIEELKRYNVEFVSSTEKFDTSTPMGNAMLNITMVFAQLERETIQKRIKDNYYTRGRKGFFLGGKTPYGFSKELSSIDNVKTSKLIPNELEVYNLIEMFELYSGNLSLGKISEMFNSRNIKAASGGNWDSLKISRMLHNPVYVKANADIYNYYKSKGCIIANEVADYVGVFGCFLFGKRDRNEAKYTDVKDHTLALGIHDGIVSSDLWLQCQYKLDSNKQIKNSGSGKNTWLSGLTKCDKCGYAMTAIVDKNRGYRYLTCRGRTNYHICEGHSVPIYLEELESDVENRLLDKIKKLKDIEYKKKNVVGAKENKLKLQIIEIENQIESYINQLPNANEILLKYINMKIMELDASKNKLQSELQKQTINSKDNKDLLYSVENTINDWHNLDSENKKQIAKLYIEKITINENLVDIIWLDF